jgi:RHS repeat-associated protein
MSGLVPLPGGDTAVYNGSGLNYIRRMDTLGSSRLATTWAHAVYSKEAYAPFGENYNEAGTTDRSFTGQDSDLTQNAGLYDFKFRKLDSTAGRWLSPDPSGWNAVDLTHPQTLNRYAYVGNSPLTQADSDGLDYTICGQGAAANVCPTYSDSDWESNWLNQIFSFGGVSVPPNGTSGPIYCAGVGICGYITYTANGPVRTGQGGGGGGGSGDGQAPLPVVVDPKKPTPKTPQSRFEACMAPYVAASEALRAKAAATKPSGRSTAAWSFGGMIAG